jgi:SNF2 family DNA or RNA helicase
MNLLSVDLAPGHSQLVVRSTSRSADVKSILAGLGVDVRLRTKDGQLTLPFDHADKLLGLEPIVVWEPHALAAAATRRHIREHAPHVLAEMRRLRDGPSEDAFKEIADSSMRQLLDEHQIRNVAAMTLRDGWGACVFDEQGTGKTVTFISAFDLLVERNLADILVVVAPKSMVAEWKAEFDRFTSGLYSVAVVDGGRREKVAALRSGSDVVVMSYESVATLRDEVVRLARRGRVVLAVDESFYAKNPESRRTEALMSVREFCVRAFVLCGTPAPNAGADLVSQFDLVDLGHTFAGITLPKDRHEANQAVRERLENAGFYLRSLKERVLELPDRKFVTVDVELEGEQKRAYEAACADLVLDLRESTDGEFAADITNFLARRAMLLRICSDPTPVVPGYSGVPAKVVALDGLLERVTAGSDKVVLWSFYRTTLDLLCRRYAEHGLVRVDGSVPSSGRREAVERFQNDPSIKVFVGNPAAAGAGLTLTAAKIAVYESMSNQAAHYMQSLDRIHRRGQNSDVTYYFLVCAGTLEVSEQQRLLDKAQAQGDLLGDDLARPTTRTALLAELLGDPCRGGLVM